MKRSDDDKLRELLRAADDCLAQPTHADVAAFRAGVRARVRRRSVRVGGTVAAVIVFAMVGVWSMQPQLVGESTLTTTPKDATPAVMESIDLHEVGIARLEVQRLMRAADEQAALARAIRARMPVTAVKSEPVLATRYEATLASAQAARVLLDRAQQLAAKLGPSDVVDRAVGVVIHYFPDSESAKHARNLQRRS